MSKLPWRYTFESPWGYWLCGSVLLWSLLPAALADVLIAPDWHAPHARCDSLGIPIMLTAGAGVPWAVVSASVSGGLVALLARNRRGGADVLAWAFGRHLRARIVSLLVLVVAVLALGEVVRHFWQAAIPQTITSDCAGRAEPITITRRGPIIQLGPICMIATTLWLLHLRSLFLSPRLR